MTPGGFLRDLSMLQKIEQSIVHSDNGLFYVCAIFIIMLIHNLHGC